METPALKSQSFYFPATPPFFLDEEETGLSLVLTAQSLTSLNYSMCFCCTMGLLVNGRGWQEHNGTALKGFGIWKPAPRPAALS